MVIGILITGGEIPDFDLVKEHFQEGVHICAADSGYDWALRNGIKCNTVVGDMDSISDPAVLKSSQSEVLKFNIDKDDTDTHIGLKYLKELNCDQIILIGGGGGRLDHLLGIYSFFETNLHPDIWYTANEKILLLDKKGYLNLNVGTKLSIFPIGKVNCSILSYGLKWDLDCVNWDFKSIGISNQVNNENSWIDPGSSKVLVILPVTGKSFE